MSYRRQLKVLIKCPNLLKADFCKSFNKPLLIGTFCYLGALWKQIARSSFQTVIIIFPPAKNCVRVHDSMHVYMHIYVLHFKKNQPFRTQF